MPKVATSQRSLSGHPSRRPRLTSRWEVSEDERERRYECVRWQSSSRPREETTPHEKATRLASSRDIVTREKIRGALGSTDETLAGEAITQRERESERERERAALWPNNATHPEWWSNSGASRGPSAKMHRAGEAKPWTVFTCAARPFH